MNDNNADEHNDLSNVNPIGERESEEDMASYNDSHEEGGDGGEGDHGGVDPFNEETRVVGRSKGDVIFDHQNIVYQEDKETENDVYSDQDDHQDEDISFPFAVETGESQEANMNALSESVETQESVWKTSKPGLSDGQVSRFIDILPKLKMKEIIEEMKRYETDIVLERSEKFGLDADGYWGLEYDECKSVQDDHSDKERFSLMRSKLLAWSTETSMLYDFNKLGKEDLKKISQEIINENLGQRRPFILTDENWMTLEQKMNRKIEKMNANILEEIRHDELMEQMASQAEMDWHFPEPIDESIHQGLIEQSKSLKQAEMDATYPVPMSERKAPPPVEGTPTDDHLIALAMDKEEQSKYKALERHNEEQILKDTAFALSLSKDKASESLCNEKEEDKKLAAGDRVSAAQILTDKAFAESLQNSEKGQKRRSKRLKKSSVGKQRPKIHRQSTRLKKTPSPPPQAMPRQAPLTPAASDNVNMGNLTCDDYHDSMTLQQRRKVDCACYDLARGIFSWPPTTDLVRHAMGEHCRDTTANQINARIQVHWSEQLWAEIKRKGSD